MTKEFLVSFETRVIIGGNVQVKANSRVEAEKIARQILRKNLNIEDCLIELGKENNNNDLITIRDMEIQTPINLIDAMILTEEV